MRLQSEVDAVLITKESVDALMEELSAVMDLTLQHVAAISDGGLL